MSSNGYWSTVIEQRLSRRRALGVTGAAAAGAERSYQISPIVLPSLRALLQGRRSATPQGLGKACARACSIAMNFLPRCRPRRRRSDVA